MYDSYKIMKYHVVSINFVVYIFCVTKYINYSLDFIDNDCFQYHWPRTPIELSLYQVD